MNETFDQVQLTQILYEISMSIGSSVELRPMLKNSLSTILKKLNCVAGSVHQQKTNQDGSYRFEVVYTIPRQPQRNATYQEALDYLPDSPTTSQYADFLAVLPFVGQSQEKNYYHILELPNFGFLLLIKNQKALSDPLIKSLTRLLNKLGAAAVSCENEAKLRQSEERYRMFTNATFDGIMVHDGPIITEINPTLAESISYSPEELIGKNIFEFLDPSCHELARANAVELTKAPYELIAVRKDGTRLPIEVTDRDYTQDGHTYRVTAVRDLSQQKQLETELESLVERRTRQVQISTQVAQAIASATDLADLYHRIVTEVKEQFGYYHTQLLRYNTETDTVQLIAGYGEIGKQMYDNGHQLPMGKGLIGTAAATGQSVLRPDLADDPDWTTNPLLPATKSEIAVPIKLGDEILGVLDVQDNVTGALTNNDQLLLEGLCGQIAVAINSTRLTSERLKTELALQESQEALQGTLERQNTLHEVGLELSNIQDLDELYQQIIIKARERLGFDRIGLFLVDLNVEELRGTYGISPKGELLSIKHDKFNFSDGDWVKKLVYSQERIYVREDTDLLEGQEVIGRGWHLTASMKIRGTLIGIIFADNMVSKQPYHSHLPELLSAYSTDAANLIDRLRADIALRQSEQVIQESLDKQQILHNVNLELATIEDLDELCQQIITKGKEELGFDRLGLYLLNEDKESMTGTYGVNDDGIIHSLASDIIVFAEQTRIGNFVNQKERQIILQDTQLFDGPEEVLGEGWHITTALWNRDIPVGVLFADNLLSHTPLQPYQSDLLSSYCSTAANLINRMNEAQALRESEQTMQKFLEKQQAIHEIGIKLSSIENPKDLYKEAIILGQASLGFDRLGLYLLDSSRTTVYGTYGIDVDGTLREESDQVHILANEPWMHRFLYHNERLSISEDSELYEDNEVVGHGWSVIAALWNQGEPIGLLFADNLLNQSPLQPYQPELLSAFGATIANLINQQQANTERARLLQNTERQAANLILLNEMSTLLNQTQTIEGIYKIAGEYTQKITNDERASLALLTPDKQMVELFGLSGLKGAVPLGTKLPVQGTGIGYALQENRQICYPEEASMDTYLDTQKMAAQGLKSAIATPLTVDGQLLGTLNVGSKTIAKDILRKKTLMQQIASLVSSAMQVKQAQERTGTILDSVTVPMLISNVSDGMILYGNDHLAEMVRLPLNELIGKQTPNFYLYDRDRETVVDKIKTEGGLQNYELELQRADQERFWGLLTAKLIQFEGKAAIITSIIDISDRIETQAATERQATDLQTVADLSTQITSIQEQQELLETIVQETQKRFDLYHCHIFLVDEAGMNLGIRACGWHPDAPEYGTHGDAVIPMKAKQSLVAQAAQTLQPVVINDVMSDPNWLPNALLPDTRSELAVPMLVGDRVIGVLDLQSTQIDRFSAEDIKIQLTLASQIAVGLENAQSLERSKAAVAELDDLTRRLTRESWEDYLSDLEETDTSFVYNLGKLSSVQDEDGRETEEETAVSPKNGHLSQSLMVHGEAIGHLTAFHEADTEQLGDDAALIIAAVAEQLSARVENIRLTDQTQQALAQTQNQAQRLGLLNEISAEMSNVETLNQVFEVIFARIPDLLDVDRVSLAMLRPDGESLEVIGYKGVDMDAPTGSTVLLSGTIMDTAIKENRVFMSDTTSTDGSLNSSMVAPLSSSGRTIGTLNVGSKKTNALTTRDETLMQQLAAMLSSVIDNKQLLAAAQARAERELQVRTITDKIRRGVDREAILTIAQKEISTLIGAKQSAAQLGTKTQLLERIQQTLAQSQQSSD